MGIKKQGDTTLFSLPPPPFFVHDIEIGPVCSNDIQKEKNLFLAFETTVQFQYRAQDKKNNEASAPF